MARGVATSPISSRTGNRKRIWLANDDPIREAHQPGPEPPDPVLARMVPMTICKIPATEPRYSTVFLRLLIADCPA
jgi:hypothetical protein